MNGFTFLGRWIMGICIHTYSSRWLLYTSHRYICLNYSYLCTSHRREDLKPIFARGCLISIIIKTIKYSQSCHFVGMGDGGGIGGSPTLHVTAVEMCLYISCIYICVTVPFVTFSDWPQKTYRLSSEEGQITITIYFINPSGKLKLSFDRTTNNISQ